MVVVHTLVVYVNKVLGYKGRTWFSREVSRSKSLIIRDSMGEIVFKQSLPSQYDVSGDGIHMGAVWPAGEVAARKAWKVAPLGSIEIEDYGYGKRALLYGFRELWKWGVGNAGFPTLE